MKNKRSENVPKSMQKRFDAIVALTDNFALSHLNEEYKTLIRQVTAALCRKRLSPLTKGRENTWACGIVHAVGMVNFLFDPSQTPHLTAGDLYAKFGVSGSTGSSKSKAVRDALKMRQLDTEWCLPSRLKDHPLAWMVEIDGMVIDARSLPLSERQALANLGIIPEVSVEKAKEPTKPNVIPIGSRSVSGYILDVHLIGGPISDKFIKKNPKISRRLEISGGMSLDDLHNAIFMAFDREEHHLYEFHVKCEQPHDPMAVRYGPETLCGDDDYEGTTEATKINQLGLVNGDVFFYWFDFGDDWWHAIELVEVKDKGVPRGVCRVAQRVGESPPQYPNL